MKYRFWDFNLRKHEGEDSMSRKKLVYAGDIWRIYIFTDTVPPKRVYIDIKITKVSKHNNLYYPTHTDFKCVNAKDEKYFHKGNCAKLPQDLDIKVVKVNVIQTEKLDMYKPELSEEKIKAIVRKCYFQFQQKGETRLTDELIAKEIIQDYNENKLNKE